MFQIDSTRPAPAGSRSSQRTPTTLWPDAPNHAAASRNSAPGSVHSTAT